METLKILIFWISFIIVVLGINCFIIPVLVNIIISLVGKLFKWEFIKGLIKDVKEDNYVVEYKINDNSKSIIEIKKTLLKKEIGNNISLLRRKGKDKIISYDFNLRLLYWIIRIIVTPIFIVSIFSSIFM